MDTDQIMYCIVALILGMLIANMLLSVCGCNAVVEGSTTKDFAYPDCQSVPQNCCDNNHESLPTQIKACSCGPTGGFANCKTTTNDIAMQLAIQRDANKPTDILDFSTWR